MQVPSQISRPGWRWGYDAEKVHTTLYTRCGCIRCGCVCFCWQSKREDVCSLVQLTRVSTAAGFDVSSMNRARAELGSTHLRRTSTGWGISLQDVPHDVVAGPFPVIDVDLDEMDQSMFGWGGAENTGLKTRVTSFLPVRSAGEIHAVVLWFEAHLLGGRQMGEGNERGGTDNVISTSPWAWDASFARGHHWESVIQVFDVDRSGKAMHVRLGDRLRLTASLNVSAQYGNGEIHFVDVEAERGTI